MGARFDRSSYAPAFLTRQGECQAECVCALRGVPPSSDTGKAEAVSGVGAAGRTTGSGKPKLQGGQTASTFAAAREGDSEREKETRWRLASPYVRRRGGVRKANPRKTAPTARRRPAHEDSVAAQPRREGYGASCWTGEFLRLELALQGKDFV